MLLIRREKEISKICLFPGLVQPFQFAQAQRRSSTRLSGKGWPMAGSFAEVRPARSDQCCGRAHRGQTKRRT
jgi:hypothetical protein